ncbi:hypothetical protein JB92DRAFT_3110925 [Gautieria morchelliformis]|nr:hypothetical protein JB92DRAFT_3110925 [Gautieria morchelliformis]
MTVSPSSATTSTTSLMPRVPKSTSASIWEALTSFFSPRSTSRHDESQQTEPEESLFLSTQSPDASPSGAPPEVADSSFSSELVDHSSPSEPVAGSSSSQPAAGSSPSHPLAESSPPQPVRCLSPSQPAAGPPAESRLSSPSQDSPSVAMPELPESQPAKELPPLIVRDFAYMPPPPLLDRPIDYDWVVHVVLPVNAVPGLRERQGEQWEASHSHLYRQGGNRADPPGAIAKTWGGLSKSEDDEMMRRAEARATRARNASLALGLTPTEPNIGGPPQRTYSVMTDEEREVVDRIDASIREELARAREAGYRTPDPTPPSTPPPLEHAHVQMSYPSVPPVRHRPPRSSNTAPRRSKRKREETDDEHDDNEAASTSKRTLPKRRNQKQDAEDAATDTDVSPGYFLRERVPPSSAETSNTKPSAASKGKGKARAR